MGMTTQKSEVRRSSFGKKLVVWRRKIWNNGIKRWWYRLFIRKNEFHKSLSIDFEAIMVMTEEDLEKYRADLLRRKAIAHQRSLARQGN